MRAFAITGIVTASWIPEITSGSDMRATPPSRRMSAGTRSSAITAQAPASSAILACSAPEHGLDRDERELRLLEARLAGRQPLQEQSRQQDEAAHARRRALYEH